MRAFVWYSVVVLVFGTVSGWSNLQNGETVSHQSLIDGYVMHGLLWGAIFFNVVNLVGKSSQKTKLIIIMLLSLTAGAIAYFYYSIFGTGEVTRNLLAGWGEDRTMYKEYPFKGYEMLSVVFFILYLISGLGFLALSTAKHTHSE